MNLANRSTPAKRLNANTRSYMEKVVGLLLLIVLLILPETAWSQRNDAVRGPTLTLIDGSTSSKKLVSVDADGNLQISDGQQQQQLDANLVLRYGDPRNSVQLDTIILRNGSRLACVVTAVKPEQVEIQSRVFLNSSIPTTAILGIVFRQKSNPTESQRVIDSILGNARREFEAVVQNGDVASGKILAPTSEDEIRLSFQNLTRTISFVQLDYLQFPVGVADSGEEYEWARIGLTDGSRLYFRDLKIDSTTIEITIDKDLTLKAKLLIRKKPFFERVCFYQPEARTYRFLTSSRPLKLVDPPKETLLKTKLNRSIVGGPLISRGTEYENGIGTHAGSQVIYAVEKDDRIFRATIALDDTANPLGHAICRVVLLGKDNSWNSAIKPLEIAKQDGPKRIEVEVSGSRAIGLITSSGKNGRTGDRVNWLDARMHR